MEQPCSSCLRTYHKIIRVNPHLSATKPNCTYDHPSETEVDTSEESLRALETRVEELERLLQQGNISDSSPIRNQFTRYSGSSNSAANPTEHHTLPGTPPGLSSAVVAEPSTTSLDDILDTLPESRPPLLSIATNEWPLSLPPRSLMLRLIDTFFTCYPHSRRVIHRPTFTLQLLEHPSSPNFPFSPLLHAICATAALYSPFVEVAPLPDLKKYPVEDVFQERTRAQEGRQLTFDEQHYMLARYGCTSAIRDGAHFTEVVQACIINGWWAHSHARWNELWMMNGLAIRLGISLGFNIPNGLRKPLPNKIRETLLIGEPLSHTDVELRRNLFWLPYCQERYHLFPVSWGFDISDEDIQQTLPGTLEAFEAGVDDGQERQKIFSADLFTTHYSNQDDFSIYVKCAIMLSRVRAIYTRGLAQHETVDEARNSPEMKVMEAIISSMRSSLLKRLLNPIEQPSTSLISNSLIAHMAPLWAVIRIHIDLANWGDPTCESAHKSLTAARSILRYITLLASTSQDYKRFDRMITLPWMDAGRALLLSLKHAPESQAALLRDEIRLVQDSLLAAGDRVTLYLRQRHMFDIEIVEHLGEREAAKIFERGGL